MTKWGRAALALVVLAVVILIALMVWEPFAAATSAPPPAHAYKAEIVRDEFGTPHIYGHTDADVAYGVARAHAEDDFTTLQDVIAMARGRYGAIAGKDGAAVDYVYYLLDARGTAERDYPKLPADTRALFEAYATGLNDYAKAHPGEVKLARLFPVNGMDVAAGFALRQPFFFGLNNVIQPLVEGKPLRPEGGPAIPSVKPTQGVVQPMTVTTPAPLSSPSSSPQASTRPMPLPWGEAGALDGSNAFAVAPKKSGGETILVSNSHQPWRGGVAWYELTVQSDQGWHFTGATFPGSPYPFLGHNEHLGWTNTVNRPDLVDVYKLVLDKDGTHYKLGNRWLPLEKRRVLLPVRFGPIVLPVFKTVYRSVHGPVIINKNGAFAFRYAGIDRLGQLDAYYRLNKATNLAQWQAVLARMEIPSTNFIYGDEKGNIAYVYNAAIPDRKPGPNWRGVLRGDDPSLIWTGPVAYDKLPKYINPASGWLFNSNNTPFIAAGPGSDLNPADFAPELGIELDMTNRARRAWTLMSKAKLLDNAGLARVKWDTGYVDAGYIAHMFKALKALDLSGKPELAKARQLLLDWDMQEDNDGRGDALALLVIKPYMSAAYQHDEWPDAAKVLGDAVDHLHRYFGRLDPPMSEMLRLRQGKVDLPLDGGSDTLRASTTWDVDKDGRLAVKHGDSFIQWTQWVPGKRVTSTSIVPYGAAYMRPDSPHFADQSTLFIQHRLKPDHFWRDDVIANAHSRKVVRHAN